MKLSSSSSTIPTTAPHGDARTPHFGITVDPTLGSGARWNSERLLISPTRRRFKLHAGGIGSPEMMKAKPRFASVLSSGQLARTHPPAVHLRTQPMRNSDFGDRARGQLAGIKNPNGVAEVLGRHLLIHHRQQPAAARIARRWNQYRLADAMIRRQREGLHGFAGEIQTQHHVEHGA